MRPGRLAHLSGDQRSTSVQRMFAQIAGHYDLMNRLMTIGQDIRWRQEVIRRAALPPEGRLLDLGSGTGDLARAALRQAPHCLSIAADFTMEMMQAGRRHDDLPGNKSTRPLWCGANALHLPFPNEMFDAVVSGFLVRNVSDLQRSLDEQWRVLAPGGRIAILDTTRLVKNWLRPWIRLYFHIIIPRLGALLTGQGEAYTYLPESTESFLSAEQLSARLGQAGFRQIRFRRLMFGSVAIHWAMKPGPLIGQSVTL